MNIGRRAPCRQSRVGFSPPKQRQNSRRIGGLKPTLRRAATAPHPATAGKKRKTTMDMQSKAKKLIEMIQTAPVEWKPLGEVVPISRGKRLVRSQLQDNGQYPVYQNSLQPLGFYDDQNCRAYMTFVIAAGAAGEIGFSDIEFWAADDCYYFDCPKEILHDKFLYYFLLSERHQLTSQIRKASVPRLGRVSIEKIKIPVPPLETQQKIVKILDKFTELEAMLETALEAELALRKRQYQYYRDFLLDFNNQIGGGDS